MPSSFAVSAVLPRSLAPSLPSNSPIIPSTTATSASAVARANVRRFVSASRIRDGRPLARRWWSGSMKSGPTLNACTVRPRRRSAPISPSATVVLPTPLWVPATAIARRGAAASTAGTVAAARAGPRSGAGSRGLEWPGAGRLAPSERDRDDRRARAPRRARRYLGGLQLAARGPREAARRPHADRRLRGDERRGRRRRQGGGGGRALALRGRRGADGDAAAGPRRHAGPVRGLRGLERRPRDRLPRRGRGAVAEPAQPRRGGRERGRARRPARRPRAWRRGRGGDAGPDRRRPRGGRRPRPPARVRRGVDRPAVLRGALGAGDGRGGRRDGPARAAGRPLVRDHLGGRARGGARARRRRGVRARPRAGARAGGRAAAAGAHGRRRRGRALLVPGAAARRRGRAARAPAPPRRRRRPRPAVRRAAGGRRPAGRVAGPLGAPCRRRRRPVALRAPGTYPPAGARRSEAGVIPALSRNCDAPSGDEPGRLPSAETTSPGGRAARAAPAGEPPPSATR